MIQCQFKVDQPRLTENHIVRVDLKDPGLRITGTYRAKEWGETMPDYTNMVMKIDTRRQKTRDFLEEHRLISRHLVDVGSRNLRESSRRSPSK